MSKKEARLARKSEKQLKQAEKSARLRATPIVAKAVRVGADPGSIFHMKMTWCCATPDCDGEWTWGTARKWPDEDWKGLVEPKLSEWSQLTWAEIDAPSSDSGHKMHHLMDTDCIVEEAQYRLVEIEQYADRIFRFRLGNKRRLWGRRVVSKFHVIWYDPQHEIYPTEPD